MPSSKGRQRVPPAVSAEVIARWGNACWLGLPGCTRIGDTSDHIVPDKLGGPTVPANLRRACRHCNSLRKERVLSGYGARYHAVIGPPCGGKSTYVDDHAAAGSIVIDFDRLGGSLVPGLTDPHLMGRHVRELATGAWYGAYRRCVSLIDPVDVWIVKTLPATPRSPRLLDEWIALDYEIVVCDPGMRVVLDRHRDRGAGRGELQGVTQWYRSGITQAGIDARQRERRQELARLGLRRPEPGPEPQLDAESVARPVW